MLELLSKEDVIKKGIEFTGDVCYSGAHGQQVYDKPVEKGGKAITGIIYERYSNFNLRYYRYYRNGVPEGQYVTFYESGNLKSYCNMKEGVILGKHIGWYENGKIHFEENCMYGVKICYKKWDPNGQLIEEKKEPSQFEKKLIEKYSKMK